jgi:hypothetical protein
MRLDGAVGAVVRRAWLFALALTTAQCAPARIADGAPLAERLRGIYTWDAQGLYGVLPDAPRMLEDWRPQKPPGDVLLTREIPSKAWRPLGESYKVEGTSEVEITEHLLARAADDGADAVLLQAGGAGATTFSSTNGGGSFVANTKIGAFGMFNESASTTAVTNYSALGQAIGIGEPGSEAWIGVSCRSYTPGAAARGSTSNATASYVWEVVPRSPAALAGIQAGDIILGVSHEGHAKWPLPCRALNSALAKAIGARIDLAVWRPSAAAAELLLVRVPPGHTGPLGVGATTFEAAEAQSVWVNVLDEAAHDLGLRIGDFILAAGERRTLSQRDLFEALAQSGVPGTTRGIALRVARAGKGAWVPVTVGTVPPERYRRPATAATRRAPPAPSAPQPPPVPAAVPTPPPPPPAGAPTSAGCTKDTDCKGARICTKGECVEPPPSR